MIPDARKILSKDFSSIGEPIVFERNSTKVYGRIVGFKGTQFKGIWSIIEFMTPGGNAVVAGRCWFKNPSEEDLKQLKHYESLEENNIYQGKLDNLEKRNNDV